MAIKTITSGIDMNLLSTVSEEELFRTEGKKDRTDREERINSNAIKLLQTIPGWDKFMSAAAE